MMLGSIDFGSSQSIIKINKSALPENQDEITNNSNPVNSIFKRYVQLKYSVFEVRLDQATINFDLNLTFIVIKNVNSSNNLFYNFLLNPIISETLKIVGYPADVKLSVEEGSETNVKIQFKGIFSEGSLMKLNIVGELQPETKGPSISISPYLDLKLTSDLMSGKLSVPRAFSLLGLNPSAHQILRTNITNEYQWNYPYRAKLNYNSTYEDYVTKQVTIQSNSQKQSVTKGEIVSISSDIKNSANTPINLQFSVPNWFIIELNKHPIKNNYFEVTFEAESSNKIEFRTNKTLGVGSYIGKIYISYGNTIIEQIEVNFKITDDNSPNYVFIIFSIIGLILVLFVIKYFKGINTRKALDYKYAVSRNQIVDKNTLPNNFNIKNKAYSLQLENSVNGSNTIGFSNYRIDFNKLTKFMSPREINIIKYIHNNKGSTQQALADHLELSKSTISRLLKEFEYNDLITRVRIGMSNNIYLKYENFKDFILNE